jgi:DnaJ-class molecular chaperone
MRQSAQQQLTQHLTEMLEKSGFVRETVEQAVTCTACNGEGFTAIGTKLELCTVCNGQRLVLQTVHKI